MKSKESYIVRGYLLNPFLFKHSFQLLVHLPKQKLHTYIRPRSYIEQGSELERSNRPTAPLTGKDNQVPMPAWVQVSVQRLVTVR